MKGPITHQYDARDAEKQHEGEDQARQALLRASCAHATRSVP